MSPGKSIAVMIIIGIAMLWLLLDVIHGLPEPPQPVCAHWRPESRDAPRHAAGAAPPVCDEWVVP